MRIVELRAENVKRIRAITIRPDGNVVTISGENGAGKSSTLDAIMYAMGGKSSHPPEVIRRGEASAQVVLELDDLVVERRWVAGDEHMAGGTTLEVRSKDGAKYSSPQAMLDKLVGSLTFDPLAFLRLEPKKQAETLRELLGLDTAAIDGAHDALYKKRTAVTAVGKELRARFDAMPSPAADVPDQSVNVAELLDEQARLQKQKDSNEALRRRAVILADAVERAVLRKAEADALVTKLKADLARAEQSFSDECVTIERLTREKEEEAAELAALVDPDVAGVTARIRSAETTNAAVRAKQARAELEQQLLAKRTEKQQLDEQLEQLAAAKAQLFAAAKFPVPGLAFTTEGLTLNGFPLEQASSAERLRVSLAMGLALNPKLKVVLIRDGSLLDAKALALVGEMAAAADAQVWLERVAGDHPVGIVIEDGQVAGLTAVESAA